LWLRCCDREKIVVEVIGREEWPRCPTTVTLCLCRLPLVQQLQAAAKDA
jgi:hypothetical protein